MLSHPQDPPHRRAAASTVVGWVGLGRDEVEPAEFWTAALPPWPAPECPCRTCRNRCPASGYRPTSSTAPPERSPPRPRRFVLVLYDADHLHGEPVAGPPIGPDGRDNRHDTAACPDGKARYSAATCSYRAANTVRTDVRAILDELAVTGRDYAVRRARAPELLQPVPIPPGRDCVVGRVLGRWP